ncbi:hypothetical protein CFC21_023852 [Triticum aestivum]|uniref:DUF1618 domain-containing protein n=3 Tax=Triticum TaxID=4564 RepID=A0A9R1PR71_TRITD|nr:uncharacterized protein LOC123045544 isoform X3 [Triticum aestivum]XP_044324568.1 uncharacterized protein LOC123045544 isoform X3 [Triticum aestivum]KAF7009298.1 hypothetical protein CFC21_023852 [Triticum aestivum]VAH48042.1 unnamed protein product [Triticum turgidum subsp. durum]
MAPTSTTWVLLKRMIFIEHDASETGGDSFIGGKNTRDAVLAYLRTLKPDACFANPPELSSLRILRPMKFTPGICGDVTSAYIASGDKNLVALFADPYRPGTNSQGGYLIYDASKNSLSTIPQPPCDYDREDVGLGAVVICLEEGAYVLVELTKVRDSEPTVAALYTWQSSTTEWVIKLASFPPELSFPNHFFRAGTCFPYRGSRLCWVDLFKGMMVCHLDALLQDGGRPEFCFIPLPEECPAFDRVQMSEQTYPLEAEEFRYIACIGGVIKFVTMDGYGERPGHEVTLTIWTLSQNLCSWKKDKVYHVRDIWKSESHISLGLPEVLPSFPVLSMDEEDVVYLFFTDLNVTEDGDTEFKGQCLIRVDMKHSKVSHHPKSADEMPSQLFSSEILASECTAYLQGVEDHQELLGPNERLILSTVTFSFWASFPHPHRLH